MDFSEISINDKALFDSYLQPHNPQVSELTFTNLFMWRNYYKFRYAQAGNCLCIIAVPAKDTPYAFLPIGKRNIEELSEAVAQLKEYFHAKGWQLQFRKVTEEQLALFDGMIDPGTPAVMDRDNSDYLYSAQDLIHLKGKKFDGKRNHINKFKKNHAFEYVSLSPEQIGECVRIMEEWCKDKNCDCQEGDYCERYANMELLNHFRELGCRGALIRVDGRFEAFTVGEMLNADTVVVHIEKANSKIEGLYPLINQQFCENEWQQAMYINREQDLGMEGLRKAKLSYNPVRLVDKYTVVIP